MESGSVSELHFGLKSPILSTAIEVGRPKGVENGRGDLVKPMYVYQ